MDAGLIIVIYGGILTGEKNLSPNIVNLASVVAHQPHSSK